jgi:hypothetical protein
VENVKIVDTGLLEATVKGVGRVRQKQQAAEAKAQWMGRGGHLRAKSIHNIVFWIK